MVTNSMAFSNKIIIFLEENVSQLNSSTLQNILKDELPKHNRNFSEVVFMGKGKTNKTFYLA